MYVKSNLHAKRRSDIEVLNVECVWIELSIKGYKYLYGTFYRPPYSPASVWNDNMYSIELGFNTNIKNIIITGDLNANLLSSNTQSA